MFQYLLYWKHQQHFKQIILKYILQSYRVFKDEQLKNTHEEIAKFQNKKKM